MNKKCISPVHPGVYLKELLDELKLSQYRLARELAQLPQLTRYFYRNLLILHNPKKKVVTTNYVL
jgi:hypothetical protein